LVHHLAFDLSEAKERGLSPAGILSATLPCFRNQWQESPTWIDPPRELTEGSLNCSDWRVDEIWARFWDREQWPLFLAAAAERLLMYSVEQRSVVLCIPQEAGRDVARMIANLLGLLPASVQYQLLCLSHVVDATEPIHGVALLFTYPETPFHRQVVQRRDPRAPVIFQLDDSISHVTSASGEYAAILLEILRSDKAPSLIHEAMRLFDALGLSPSDLDLELFEKAWRLGRRFEQFTCPSQLPDLAALFAEVSAYSDMAAQYAEDLAIDMLLNRVVRLRDSVRHSVLVAISREQCWPREVRQVAGNKVINEIDRLFTKAEHGEDEVAQAISCLLVAGDLEFATTLDWAQRALRCPSAVWERLRKPIIERLSGHSGLEFGAMRSTALEDGRFGCEIYLPCLQLQLGRLAPHTKDWERLARYLVELALRKRTEIEHVRWLASRNRNATAKVLSELCQQHADMQTRLHRAMEAASLPLPPPLCSAQQYECPSPYPYVAGHQAVRISSQSRRQLPRSGGDLPILFGLSCVLALSVLGVFLVATFYRFYHEGRMFIDAGFFAWSGLASLILWGGTETFVLWLRRLGHVRVVRWTAIIVLAVGLAGTGRYAWDTFKGITQTQATNSDANPQGRSVGRAQ